MMRKVKIKRAAPNNKKLWPSKVTDKFSDPDLSVRKTLQPVPRDKANLEAEKGETVFGDTNFDGIPEHFTVGGQKHYNGGTPLNLPAHTFIFSDDKDLKVKDEGMLREFGKSPRGRKGYTPADLAKQYDINDYRRILQDPESDDIQRKTAEMMISNYNLKLGKLSLLQESKKGFPDGIPQVAIPFITTTGIDPELFVTGTPDAKGKPTISPELYAKLTGRKQKGVFQDGGFVAPTLAPPVLTPMEVVDPPLADLRPKGPSLGDPSFAASYASMQQLLNNPANTALRKAIYEDYKKKMPDSDLTEGQVIDNFLEAQRQIYAIQAANKDNPDALRGKDWDRGGKNKNAVYNQTASSLGMTPLSEDQIKSFQAVYQSLQDLSGTDEFKPLLGSMAFGMGPIGLSDQQRKNQAVSPIDGIFGNTTVGQMAIVAQPQQQTKPAEQKTTPTDTLKVPELEDPKKARPAEWWLQDITKTAGAFGDYQRIKKYMPWAAPLDAYLPTPTFYDPTRELAANAEQSSIVTQGLTAFSGPQALSSRASEVQGTAAKNAADIMSRYANLNVGAANQAELYKAQILNETSNVNRGISQDLYDKTQLVNQQFDNAKAKAREQLRQSYIDAVTNRANAQVLNDMYPQYNISPITGGMMVFNGGRKLKPDAPTQQNLMDVASDYMHMYPGFTPQQYVDAAKSAMGIQSPGYGYMPDPQYLENYMSMMQQQQE